MAQAINAPPPPRPEALPLRPEHLPPALAAYDHFLLWDWVLRDGRDGPRWTKPPIKVVGAGQARSTSPADWGSLAAALVSLRKNRRAGIGFALSPDDPFCFGDVDDCRDPATGEIAAWARPLLRRFAFTYQEVSPSGTGVKILIRGTLPGPEHRWRLDPTNPLAYVEWFDRGKYTTLTGHRLDGAAADVADGQAALDALYAEVRPMPAAAAPKPAPSTDANPDDDALLNKARSSRDGARFIQLFDTGNIGLYGNDESAADIALCGMLAFWLGPDPDRIDRVFRRSALVRDKWLDRPDYRRLTIDKVLAGRTDFYAPGRRSTAPAVGVNGAAPATDESAPEAVATPPPEPWPELDEAALHGLAGDVVYAMAPHTEADDVATLATFLVLFGAACNRGPGTYAGEDRHGSNLFAVLVGATSKARKGTSLAGPKRLLASADPRFVAERFMDGLSSGEGLIWQVRDEVRKINRKGDEIVESQGVDDKRLVCVEEEFAGLLSVAERQGNTISPVVRRAWDARGLLASTTKNSPARATNPHIAILGHITSDELKRTLTDTAVANGLGNRFLWCAVRRSKVLPHPGRVPDEDLAPLSGAVRSTLEFARGAGELTQDGDAWSLWSEVYEGLSEGRPGLAGALAARAEAQALRLSLIYALLDRSRSIGAVHLRAALAFWRYCEASIRLIFGDATGDPHADRILAALRANGPMTQTDVSGLFGRNLPAGKLGGALQTLVIAGLVRSDQGSGANGRAPTVWAAVR